MCHVAFNSKYLMFEVTLGRILFFSILWPFICNEWIFCLKWELCDILKLSVFFWFEKWNNSWTKSWMNMKFQLWNDIGYMSFHLKTFSVEQKYQTPTNSLIDNNKQITNGLSVLKLWLPELIMSKFWDCSRTLLWQQLIIC